MILLPVLIILGVLLTVCIYRPEKHDDSFALYITFILVSGIMLGLVAVPLAMKLPCNYTLSQDKIYDIVSIRDNSVTQGSIFLIHSEGYYFFYRKLDEGFVLDKIYASSVIVYEGNITVGYIEKSHYSVKFKHDWYKYLVPFPLSNKNIERPYKIYVPEGSIVRDFVLDAQ